MNREGIRSFGTVMEKIYYLLEKIISVSESMFLGLEIIFY